MAQKINQFSASQEFAKILKVARMCSAAVGTNIASPNYRMNWLTYVVFFLISIYFLLTAWTIIKMFDGDLLFMLEACCMSGSVIQGTTKMISGIIRTEDFLSTRLLLEDIYSQYELKGPLYCQVLYSSCRRARKVVSGIAIGYIICISGILGMPFIMMGLNGNHYTLMHYHIPALDIKTNFGYFSTLAIHGCAVVAAAFGLFAGDIFVLIYLIQCFLFVDILRLKILELNEYSMFPQISRHKNITKVLIDIVNWHQLYLNFTRTCNCLFYYIVGVQVSTSALSIVLTIFVLMRGDWPVGYPYLIIVVYNMYVYCILGTKIELCNDDFIYEIYNISWYHLSAYQQKTVQLMLMKSQKPVTIDIAGVLPLSVSTALQITKTIYSICMLLGRGMS